MPARRLPNTNAKYMRFAYVVPKDAGLAANCLSGLERHIVLHIMSTVQDPPIDLLQHRLFSKIAKTMATGHLAQTSEFRLTALLGRHLEKP